MNLARKTVTVILTEDGRSVLSQLVAGLPESPSLAVEVQEAEDLGVWIRVEMGVEVHFLLIRWEYILLMDVKEESGRLVGKS